MKYSVALLLQLGTHIGKNKSLLLPMYHSYLVGTKYGLCIFNIDLIYYFFRRANQLMYLLGKSNGKLLLYYHNLVSKHNLVLDGYFYSRLSTTGNMYFDRWKAGCISNMNLYSDIIMHDIFNVLELETSENNFLPYGILGIKSLFSNLIRFTYTKKIAGMSWEKHQIRFKKYWRFFLFFKYYLNMNRMPDVILYFSDKNYRTPAVESNALKIPLISILDVDIKYRDLVSYPLIGNSSSYLSSAFYFSVLLQRYLIGKTDAYSFLEEKDNFASINKNK